MPLLVTVHDVVFVAVVRYVGPCIALIEEQNHKSALPMTCSAHQ